MAARSYSLLRDPLDVRISPSPEGEVVLVGVPWDWSTAGRPGARFAPGKVRGWIYRFTGHAPGSWDFKCKVNDLGDVEVAPGDFTVTSRRIVDAARLAYSRGVLAVFLGGDHSITRWLLEPLASDTLGILVLDAHYDLRSVSEGYTSGSWLWDLHLEHKGRVHAAVVGVSDFANPGYMASRAREAGFTVVPRYELIGGLEAAYEAVDRLKSLGAKNYYVSVDVDHLHVSYAPGVNSQNPMGMTPWESLKILEYAGRALKPRGLDLVELVPDADVADITVSTASKLLLYAINSVLEGCGG
ncbi:MAG: arginase family protein [Thermoprotei archaeon]|nr:arginase family protein [Thermoprotei archaeon]